MSRCKQCRRELTDHWRKGNPEKKTQSKRTQHLKRYNLDEIAYFKLGNACWICGATEPGYGRKNFFIDHDHTCCPDTGSQKRSCGECIRGLLCGDCNFGLSKFKDDPKLLREAAYYVEGGYSEHAAIY